MVYQLGYIAAIVGLVMVICTFKGYTLFGGRLNMAGIVVCVLISVGMLYVAEQAALALEIQQAMSAYIGEISFFDAYRSISEFMEFPDVKNAVIYDLVMGYLLMAVGSFSLIWQTYRKHNVTPGVRPLGPIRSKTGVQ